MEPRGLKVTQNAYFSLLTHTKQLLLVTFCHPTAGIVKWDGTDGRRRRSKDGRRIDMKVESYVDCKSRVLLN